MYNNNSKGFPHVLSSVSLAISAHAAEAYNWTEVPITAASASPTPSTALLPRLLTILPVRVSSTLYNTNQMHFAM